MNKKLSLAVGAAFSAMVGTSVQAQELDYMCMPHSDLHASMKNEYGEVPIISIRDPINNDLYEVFARNVDAGDLGSSAWTLYVTDPEQMDPNKESCLIDMGGNWNADSLRNLSIGAQYPIEVLEDLNTLYELQGNCISSASHVRLKNELWMQTEEFRGNSIDTNDNPYSLVITSNENGEGFVGYEQILIDIDSPSFAGSISMHPFAIDPKVQYCQSILGTVEFDSKVGLGEEVGINPYQIEM